jgi:hypothetical protein
MWRGKIHTVATDGHRLIAVPHDYGCAPFPDDFAPAVLKLLDAPNGERKPIDLAALRAFVSRIAPPFVWCANCDGEGTAQCPECDGEGFHSCVCDCGNDHTKDCRYCRGAGEIPCSGCSGKGDSAVRMRIGGQLFNARIIASPPELLSGDVATITHYGQDRAAVIDGDGWRLVMMPMRECRMSTLLILQALWSFHCTALVCQFDAHRQRA